LAHIHDFFGGLASGVEVAPSRSHIWTDEGLIQMKTDTFKMTETDLARLGGGVLGYVKELDAQQAGQLLGPAAKLPPQSKFFALFNADGSPISISGTRDAALGSAFEHALVPASVH
jgi:hypothetical protein